MLLLFTGRAAAVEERPASEASARENEIAGFELSVARTPQARDCPDAPELSAATARVGTGPTPREDEPEKAPLLTHVVFDRDAQGYSAEIRSTGRKSGVRVLRDAGETCAPLAEATTVVLAVLLDLLPESAEPPAPAPVAAPSPAAATPAASPGPAPPRRQSVVVTVGVDGGVAVGLLDQVAAGTLGAALRPSYGRWELGVGALWAPTRNFPFASGSVDVMLLSGRIIGCGWLTPSASRSGLAACAGVLFGVLRGEGHDFDQNRSTTQFWPLAEVGLRGRVVLGEKWGLRFGVSGLVPLRRLTFSVERLAVAYETPSFGALFELGPELRL